MKKGKESESALAVSMFFLMIVSIFSLFRRVVSGIAAGGSLGRKVEQFLVENTLWIIIVVVIILILNAAFVKLSQDKLYETMNKPIIKLTVGILVVIDGLVNLSTLLPMYIINLNSSVKSAQMMGKTAGDIVRRVMIRVAALDIISVVIIICQILLGLYLIKGYRTKEADNLVSEGRGENEEDNYN